MTSHACRATSTPARVLVALGLAVFAMATQADVGRAVTIAKGLSSPRGLDFAPNGVLYVAEAGRGGDGSCTPSPANPTVQRCYGETGSIAKILPHGGFRRVFTGLPSLRLPDGAAEGGPVDISFFGMAPTIVIGWGGDPALRAGLGRKSGWFGTLLRPTSRTTYRVIADISQHEVDANPDGGAIDSNPYSVLALPGRWIVADAGANALVEVPRPGSTRTFTELPWLPEIPPIPGERQPVPTSLAEGPEGAIHVGLLTSFPFWQGSASVLRVSSDGSDIARRLGQLTAVVDVAFDRGGGLYVLEVARGQALGTFPPPDPGIGIGRLLRKCPGDKREVLLEGLTVPGGVAIGHDGAVYLTNYGLSPDQGEVLRLRVRPC